MPVLCQSIHCSNKEIKVYTNHEIMKIPKIIIKQPNHIVIQRMEDVVIVWFDKIQRELIHHNKLHSHNNVQAQGSINEQYCIWNYCRKILSHIILDGKIQTTTTITNINRPIYDDPEFPYSILCKKPLPSLQDISCMVVTIRHWYYHLVQHPVQLYQNYPKEILYLYHRFVTNQQQEEQEQQITIETYIRTCETNVRKWIGLSDDEIITSIEPIDQQPKQQQQQHNSNRPLPLDEVGSTNFSTSTVYAMKQPNKFQQQQQRTCTYPTNDIVPTNITSSLSISCTPTNENYKKLSARSVVSCTLDNVKNKDKNKSNHNKPVARPDIVDLTVDEESIKQYENRQMKTKNTNKRIKRVRRINKPTTQADVIDLTIDEDSTVQCQNCQTTTTTTVRSNNIAIRNNDSLTLNSNSNDKINRLRGMILMMYHAEKCPFQNDPTLTDNDSSHHTCRIYDGCSVIKQLHQHVVNRLFNDDDNNTYRYKIVSSNCSHSKLHKCKYGILCHDAKEAMYHYAHCHSTNICIICGPVVRQLPNMEHEIHIAVTNELNVNNIENDSHSNNRNKRKAYHRAYSRLSKQQKLSNVNATSSNNDKDNTTVSQSPPIALLPQKRLSTTPITTTKVKQRYRPRRHKQVSRYTCRII